MKKLLPILCLLALIGCSDVYDDSEIKGKYDDLQEMCRKMNSNISAMQAIVNALQNNDYITSVIPVTEGGETIGYTITFAKGSPITIYHGTDGKGGADGKDGYTPQIGVKQDTDNIYYWTLDGEWLLDENGNKIKAQGTDGKDGQDGENGADGNDGATGPQGPQGEQGITPLLKIENDYWYISYDNGTTWTQLGKATGDDGQDGQNGTDGVDGKDGDSFFQSITQDESNVYFTLADGTVITIPKGLALSIEFAESDLVVMSPNSSREIGYTVTSATATVKVEVTSSADIKAKVVADNASGLTGKIHITTGDAIDEYSKVIVFVSNGDKVIMRSITFEEAGLVVEENATKQATAKGGEMTLEFLSNVECEVVIPKEAQDWISLIPTTRAMTERKITLKLTPNNSYDRCANIIIRIPNTEISIIYSIEQYGNLGVYVDPKAVPYNELWYTMNTREKGCLGDFNKGYDFNAFADANIVEHVFEDGIWKIRFDKELITIDWLSSSCVGGNITNLYFPDSVKYIKRLPALNGDADPVEFAMKELYIPLNLKYIWLSSYFLNKLSRFYGNHISEDGRCVIIDETLYAFASRGVGEEYIIPQGVKIIDGAFQGTKRIKRLIIPEGVVETRDALNGMTDLEYVYLPSSYVSMPDPNAPVELGWQGCYIFIYSDNIKKFDGNCKFISKDGYCFIHDNYQNSGACLLRFATGAGLTSYEIPDGVAMIENYSFGKANALTELTFPSTIKKIGGHALNECSNIEKIYGPNVTEDNKSLVVDGELIYVAPKGLKKYTTPEGVKILPDHLFFENNDLNELVISDDVVSVKQYGYIARHCSQLTTVTISARMRHLGLDPFWGCSNLKNIYLRALVPPVIRLNNYVSPDFKYLTIYVPEESLQAYLDAPDWAPYRDYIKGYKYTDLPENISSDYSQDGVVTTLQTASVGNGIDIVLMGDAYSDRQIADGSYKADMENLYNNLFTEEPYKSFKDHFNVYSVNVVSATEGYEYGNTALDGYFGGGTYVGGNDSVVFNYAQKAIGEERMDEAMIVVAMNSDNYAGTCWMYYPEGESDYGKGVSISYFPRGGDAETFAALLHHEACGHGFAKLADEYAYEEYGAITDFSIAEIQYQHSAWGWWKNVDFTNDTNEVHWSHFLADERYANEGLGVFEGGLTYWSGVWRPSENSIMRYNTGGFNAPSREAIYYRIHKLAYGAEWEYDYEEFVEWDAKNRMTAASAPRKVRIPMRQMEHTAPPVVVKKSWREAMK